MLVLLLVVVAYKRWAKNFNICPRAGSTARRVLDKDLVMKLTPKAPIRSVQDEFDQIYIRIPESE